MYIVIIVLRDVRQICNNAQKQLRDGYWEIFVVGYAPITCNINRTIVPRSLRGLIYLVYSRQMEKVCNPVELFFSFDERKKF